MPKQNAKAKEKPKNVVIAVLEKAIADRKKKHAELEARLDAPSPAVQRTRLLLEGIEKSQTMKPRDGLKYLDNLKIELEKLDRKRSPSVSSIIDRQFAIEDEIKELEHALARSRFYVSDVHVFRDLED